MYKAVKIVATAFASVLLIIFSVIAILGFVIFSQKGNLLFVDKLLSASCERSLNAAKCEARGSSLHFESRFWQVLLYIEDVKVVFQDFEISGVKSRFHITPIQGLLIGKWIESFSTDELNITSFHNREPSENPTLLAFGIVKNIFSIVEELSRNLDSDIAITAIDDDYSNNLRSFKDVSMVSKNSEIGILKSKSSIGLFFERSANGGDLALFANNHSSYHLAKALSLEKVFSNMSLLFPEIHLIYRNNKDDDSFDYSDSFKVFFKDIKGSVIIPSWTNDEFKATEFSGEIKIDSTGILSFESLTGNLEGVLVHGQGILDFTSDYAHFEVGGEDILFKSANRFFPDKNREHLKKWIDDRFDAKLANIIRADFDCVLSVVSDIGFEGHSCLTNVFVRAKKSSFVEEGFPSVKNTDISFVLEDNLPSLKIHSGYNKDTLLSGNIDFLLFDNGFDVLISGNVSGDLSNTASIVFNVSGKKNYLPGFLKSASGKIYADFFVLLDNSVKGKNIHTFLHGHTDKADFGHNLVPGFLVSECKADIDTYGEDMTISGTSSINGEQAIFNFYSDFQEKTNLLSGSATLRADDIMASDGLGNALSKLLSLSGKVVVDFKMSNFNEKSFFFDMETDLTGSKLQAFYASVSKKISHPGKIKINGYSSKDVLRIDNCDISLPGRSARLFDSHFYRDQNGKYQVNFAFDPDDEYDAVISLYGDKNRSVFNLKGKRYNAEEFDIAKFFNRKSSGKGKTDTLVSLDFIKLKNDVFLNNFKLEGDCSELGCKYFDMNGFLDDESKISGGYGNKDLCFKIDNAERFLAGIGYTNILDRGQIIACIGKFFNQESRNIKGFVEILRFRLVKVRAFSDAAEKNNLRGLYSKIQEEGGKGIYFDSASSRFVISSDKLHLRDGSMRGALLGITFDGGITIPDGQLDITGTLAPMYVVNSIVSQVPIFGELLAGGKNKGLLGMSYYLKGSIYKPSFTFNPLSLLTPGFLRNIFEIFHKADVIAE